MVRIKELRLEEGMTQKQLAEMIGVAWYNVGDWERGKAEPSIRDLIRLADVFGCTIDELVGRESAPTFLSANNGLTKDERELLLSYRCLNKRGQSFLAECIYFAVEKQESAK